ncbi:hypothetical protein CDAR_171421 [Caerostris darwini]|uniref:Uncharacterized protein n=1 Tax=Caerostris darwini TaxID=1538125 RepID=A0AAV4WQ92_9ARAC|nr:hypothetical protein CDAR_171421 [Caerostris darwini]
MKASSATYPFALMAGVKNNKKKGRREGGNKTQDGSACRGKSTTQNAFRLQCSTNNKEEVWPVFPLSLQLDGLLSILAEHFTVVLAVRRNAPCTAECGNFYVYCNCCGPL